MRFQKASILFFFLIGFSWSSFAQFTIPEKPDLQTSVYDYVSLLSAGDKKNLEEKLIRYSDTTSTQIVVVIYASSEGENINYLGAQWGQKWGIGQEKEDNGVLILVAYNDRKIAINTGFGVEGRLTDAVCKRIIEQIISPEFKKGDYAAGLNKGADAIFFFLSGEYQNALDERGKTDARDKIGPGLIVIIILIVLFVILWAISKNKGGGNRGGRKKGLDIWDVIILSNMGRGRYKGGSGNFGGGGFGGGGFGGGFGGGGFGGGGASGGW